MLAWTVLSTEAGMDLRLKRDSELNGQGEQGEQPRLLFPREALDQARQKAKLPNPLPPVGDLASRLEAELDRVQENLNRVREDVDALYRFPKPGDDDGPPSTAA